jgi:hypothetical protein
MLARLGPRTSARAAMSVLIGALAACSSLPEPGFPAFADHHVDAEFVVPAEGRLRLPATTRALVVHELGLHPAPLQEQFDAAGGRWLVYPAGTNVHVRCRFRAYAGAGGSVPAAADVLVGARSIRMLEAP